MGEMSHRIQETGSGLEIPLHVQPRARSNAIAGLHGGAVKLKVTAPPLDDAANRAVIDFFAAALDIPKARLSIVAGSKSRDKVLRITNISRNQFLSRFPSLAG